MIDDALRRDAPEAPYRVAVHGHGTTLRMLRRGLGTLCGAQAYLLSGPPGVGKRTVARYLSQALLCRDTIPGEPPCGACRTCRLVREEAFGDQHVLQSPVRIDAVRQLQHMLALAPSEATRRVALVPDVETASIGAANCLLKTLEEPPGHAVIVLTTSAPERVPATVRSRCRTVPLRPLPGSVVAGALRDQWHVASDHAELLAGLADGRLGWAVSAIEDSEALRRRDAWLDSLSEVLNADAPGRLSRAADLTASRDAAATFLGMWRGWWRDVLLVALGLDDAVVNSDRAAELAGAARRYGMDDIVSALRLIDDVLDRLVAHANERLAVEVLVLGMPR